VSTATAQPPRRRRIIADGFVLVGIGLSIVLPHRARAVASVAYGSLAMLVLLILLLRGPSAQHLASGAEPRSGVVASRAWVIPERVVRCESSEQNLPPNEAGAAGYYQITPESWADAGGPPPDDASKHSKLEQDLVAARLWARGAGAARWVCK
jgi:hypothetical protein